MEVYDKEKGDSKTQTGNDFDDIVAHNFSPFDEAGMEKRASEGAQGDRDNIRQLEDSYNAPAYGEDSKEAGNNAELDKEAAGVNRAAGNDDRDLYTPSTNDKPGSGGKLKMLASAIGKRKGLYIGVGGGVTGLIISLIIGFGAFLPFQLVHIKEAITQKFSSVQENITGKRQMRLYKNAYFFRTDADNARFAGYKSKGSLFSFLDNRQSTRLVSELEKKGFKIDAEVDADGKWTGRFLSIEGPDGAKINSSDSIWARRSALRNTINELYPTKSLLWRNYQTSKLFNRFGWNRMKWWSDNALTRKLDDLEARWRSKLKTALKRRFGSMSVGVNSKTSGEPEDPNATAEAEAKAKAGGLQSSITEAIEDEADPSAVSKLKLDGDSMITTALAGSLAGSLANIIKITGKLDDACDIKRALNMIVTASRTLKAAQLANAALKILSLADGIKVGKVDGRSISEAMHMINSVDPDTKNSFFGSGGWSFVKGGNKFKPTYSNTYDTGGGLTGKLASVNRTVDNILGKGTAQKTCKTLSNVFVSIGSGIVGIASTIVSGGSVLIGQIIGGIAWGIAKAFVIQYATVLGIKIAAGSVVDGSERGERLGDLVAAGSGVLFSTNAAASGMRPLTTQEYAYQQQQYLAERQEELSEQSFLVRYFNPEDANSLTGKAIAAVASVKTNSIAHSIASIPSLLLSPLTYRSAMAVDEYSCEQEDIAAAGIETDPFCTPIMGNTDTELDKIEPLDNVKWMYDNGYVDGSGNPDTTTENGKIYSQYVKDCFENDNVNILFKNEDEWSSDFVDRCFNSGDAANSIGLHERFRAFRTDSTLLICLDKIINTGTCEEETAAATTNTSLGVSPDGFVFPLVMTKQQVIEVGEWCYKSQENCHHDYNAVDVLAPTGTTVVAPRDGTVTMVKDNANNHPARISFRGSDGNLYYMTHMLIGSVKVTVGQQIKAGDIIGQVGTAADGEGVSHLHLDALPPDYDSRPGCSSAECTPYPFINLQPAMIAAFENLP